MDMMADKKYVFKVLKTATKPEIAKAVEEMFKVDVKCVNTINMKKKPKRLGRTRGLHHRMEKGYRHAQARLQDHRVL